VVGAPIGRVGQELVQQIAVGGVDLDAVHARVDGPPGRCAEVCDDPGDLGGFQRPRHRQRFLAVRRVRGHLGSDRRGRHRFAAADVGVRHPTDVPDLHEDQSVTIMDGLGDLGPLALVGIGVDARGVEVGAVAVRRDGGGLGDDEPGRRPLRVVLDLQVTGRTVGVGPAAGERRHEDPVARGHSADGDRCKQSCVSGQGVRHACLKRHGTPIHSRRGPSRSLRKRSGW
jgi:hypothetical protein